MLANLSCERTAPSVLVVSDLHLDLWKRTGRDPLAAVPDALWHGLEAVIVAGDLSNEAPRKWPRHLARLAALPGAPALYLLPGNHDYYGLPLGDDATLGALCHDAGARLVQKQELRFGPMRLLCATLWTDQRLPGGWDLSESADFRRILPPSGQGRLSPEDFLALHQDQLQWLEARLAAPWEGQTCVVTHHAPDPAAVLAGQTPENKNVGRAAGFASDLGALIARYQPAAWVFGHVHRAFEARIGTTVLRNLAFGTPDEVAPGQELARLQRGLLCAGHLWGGAVHY